MKINLLSFAIALLLCNCNQSSDETESKNNNSLPTEHNTDDYISDSNATDTSPDKNNYEDDTASNTSDATDTNIQDTGTVNPPVQGEPCGEGWPEELIPGDIDLGLASNPAIYGITNGTPDERAIFDQINEERIVVGLEPLKWSDQVANVARSHAADMNQLDYFDHGSSTRPYRVEGVTNRENWLPLPRLEYVYPGDFRRCGENIARTRNPVENVVEMWMNSDGHRAAILDEYGWSSDVGAIGIDENMIVFHPAQCAH